MVVRKNSEQVNTKIGLALFAIHGDDTFKLLDEVAFAASFCFREKDPYTHEHILYKNHKISPYVCPIINKHTLESGFHYLLNPGSCIILSMLNIYNYKHDSVLVGKEVFEGAEEKHVAIFYSLLEYVYILLDDFRVIFKLFENYIATCKKAQNNSTFVHNIWIKWDVINENKTSEPHDIFLTEVHKIVAKIGEKTNIWETLGAIKGIRQ